MSSAANKYNEFDLDNSDWLTTREAAIYIRAFDDNGNPCPGRIRNLVGQRKLTPHKPFGRLLFSRVELKKLIEASRLG